MADVTAGQVALTQNGNSVAGSPFTLDTNGMATFSYTPSAPETDVFLAGYLGVASQYNPSNSQPVTEIVADPTQNTVTTLNITPNPSSPGQPVTVTIHVTTAS